MDSKRVGDTTVSLVKGDITKQSVDAIVNAANSGLMGGGGVDGAIHRAGGGRILEECKEIVAKQGRCPAGQAVTTSGGNLPAKFVIHAVGPRYNDGKHREAETLAGAYESSLRQAKEVGAKTVAFPSISTGAYGYPVNDAARVALGAVTDFCKSDGSFSEIRFVLFDDRTLQAYRSALQSIE